MTQRDFNAYFGPAWPSGICDDGGHQIDTPTGEHCQLCEELIKEGDRGSFVGVQSYTILAPVHRECSLRSVMGGIGHLEDHSVWCKEMHDPDGGEDYRTSAVLVWNWIEEHGVPNV
jgi:hypothetical protein